MLKYLLYMHIAFSVIICQENYRSIEQIESEWEIPFGDRKIELVFIGQKLDPKKITKELENCLLNDNELSDWNQGNFKNTDEWPIPN